MKNQNKTKNHLVSVFFGVPLHFCLWMYLRSTWCGKSDKAVEELTMAGSIPAAFPTAEPRQRGSVQLPRTLELLSELPRRRGHHHQTKGCHLAEPHLLSSLCLCGLFLSRLFPPAWIARARKMSQKSLTQKHPWEIAFSTETLKSIILSSCKNKTFCNQARYFGLSGALLQGLCP